jgi:hypothetical protein
VINTHTTSRPARAATSETSVVPGWFWFERWVESGVTSGEVMFVDMANRVPRPARTVFFFILEGEDTLDSENRYSMRPPAREKIPTGPREERGHFPKIEGICGDAMTMGVFHWPSEFPI